MAEKFKAQAQACGMKYRDFITRKIELKQQARDLINEEIKELVGQFGLLVLKEVYEGRIAKDADAELHRRLDCIIYLLGE